MNIEISDTEAYEILNKPDCPIRLPKARSMTQAKIDLDSLKSSLREWNSQIKQSLSPDKVNKEK